LYPLIGKSLELVGVAVTRRISEAQRGKFKNKNLVAVAQLDRFFSGYPFVDDRLIFRLRRLKREKR
jgi:hypothetical protein